MTADIFWHPIDNEVSSRDIQNLEDTLNIILPNSYKHYLQYKHFYDIFWDINIVLYPKPLDGWQDILIDKNNELKEYALDKGYLAIGDYSDYGIIGLKLGTDESDEQQVVMIDAEIDEVTMLANAFPDLLENILVAEIVEVK